MQVRLVQVGEIAGPCISLPAAILHSAGLEIVGAGSGAVPPMDVLMEAFRQVMTRGARKKVRIEVESAALADIEEAWQREGRSRLVVVPGPH